VNVIEVTSGQYQSVIDSFVGKQLGIDTETTGKSFSDVPFVLTIAEGDNVYYFDVKDVSESVVRAGLFFSHNIKFDIMMLEKIGVKLDGDIHCTMITERLLRNDMMAYSLDATAKRYGYEKDDSALAFIKQNKLYEERKIMGVTMDKVPQYSKLPKELLLKYATTDAHLHLKIGQAQLAKLNEPA